MVIQQLAGRVVVEAIFYVGLASIVAVSLFWRWWRDILGWSVIASTAALVIAVIPGMIRIWFGPAVVTTHPWLTWVTIAALALDPVITAWRVWVLWILRQQAARGDPPPRMHA